MALQPSALDLDDPYPESQLVRERDQDVKASMKRASIGLGALAGASLLLWAPPAKADLTASQQYRSELRNALRGP